jgi:hypothetical protein
MSLEESSGVNRPLHIRDYHTRMEDARSRKFTSIDERVRSFRIAIC